MFVSWSIWWHSNGLYMNDFRSTYNLLKWLCNVKVDTFHHNICEQAIYTVIYCIKRLLSAVLILTQNKPAKRDNVITFEFCVLLPYHFYQKHTFYAQIFVFAMQWINKSPNALCVKASNKYICAIKQTENQSELFEVAF